MNILIITNNFPDEASIWGGIFVKEQANALYNAGHKVWIVKIEVDDSKFAILPSFKPTIINNTAYSAIKLSVSKSIPIYNQFNFFLTSFLAISKIHWSKKFDVIHCHYSYPSGIVGYLLSKKWGIPYIITEHSFMRMLFRSKTHKILSTFVQTKANALIAVSNALKQDIEKNITREVNIVPNLIFEERFSIKKEQKLATFNIGFIGTLNGHGKGLDFLLNTLQDLKTFDWHLHIGGNGTNYNYYKDLAEKYNISNFCTFYGDIENSKIPAFYNLLDVFILPSRFETFGIVIIEAMASGLPVISTKCGGPDSIITPETGILVEIDNIEMLADAINYVYLNPNKFDAEVIRNYAIANFGKQSFIKNVTNIYNKTVNKQ